MRTVMVYGMGKQPDMTRECDHEQAVNTPEGCRGFGPDGTPCDCDAYEHDPAWNPPDI